MQTQDQETVETNSQSEVKTDSEVAVETEVKADSEVAVEPEVKADSEVAVETEVKADSEVEISDKNENLATDANHAEDEIFTALDALELDEESKTYVANQKKFYAGASEAGRKNIEKVLADKFLSK
jgi:hypothetical protein